uniref:Uncharacterized protein n=1 Tax=Anopheles culicifacies TaxID=139723 RepID=A0A182M1R4_9DIPT
MQTDTNSSASETAGSNTKNSLHRMPCSTRLAGQVKLPIVRIQLLSATELGLVSQLDRDVELLLGVDIESAKERQNTFVGEDYFIARRITVAKVTALTDCLIRANISSRP